MSDVTVIGLGRMGSALARAFRDAGYQTTVWNRSPGKTRPFVDDTFTVAPDVASAVAASPMVVICIDDNPAADALLNETTVRQHLSGRIIVQLSTSTPQEASDSEDLLNAAGALYLDGAIDCGPDDIGTPSTLVLVSGNEAAFDQAGRLLDSLGGETRFLGPNVRAASVLALASVCEAYGRFMAVTHAACMCDSEGVDLDALAKMFPEDSFSRRYIEVVNSSDYQNPGGTLPVWGQPYSGFASRAPMRAFMPVSRTTSSTGSRRRLTRVMVTNTSWIVQSDAKCEQRLSVAFTLLSKVGSAPAVCGL